MEDAKERINCAASAVCDGLRQIGDVSYAILPKDIAHALGDLKKAFLNNLRSCVDWEIGWIDERVAGGDRLREEWKQKCSHNESDEAAEAAN
jgi:hypothetical protein